MLRSLSLLLTLFAASLLGAPRAQAMGICLLYFERVSVAVFNREGRALEELIDSLVEREKVLVPSLRADRARVVELTARPRSPSEGDFEATLHAAKQKVIDSQVELDRVRLDLKDATQRKAEVDENVARLRDRLAAAHILPAGAGLTYEINRAFEAGSPAKTTPVPAPVASPAPSPSPNPDAEFRRMRNEWRRFQVF